MNQNLARVFPRRTEGTPNDKLSFVGKPPQLVSDLGIEQVQISVTFSYDLPRVFDLVRTWETIAPVDVGGPAFDDPGGDFVPGQYLKRGYVITSRGCPNNCWFCSVPKREGRTVRELPITDGYNVLDSNLLACSDSHIKRVFEMLQKQKERAQFTGGLEAARLKEWHVALLWALRPAQIFMAYDTPDDLEPLIEAGRMLRYANFTRYHLRCYVLIGYPKDTMKKAERRLYQAYEAGFLPMAMLYRDWKGKQDKEWERFQRQWARPAATKCLIKEDYVRQMQEEKYD